MSESPQRILSDKALPSIVTGHSTMFFMSAVVVWLLWGAIDEGGSGVWVLVTFAAAMIGAYTLLCRIAKHGPVEKVVLSLANAIIIPTRWRHSVLVAVAALPIVTSAVHYIWFNGFSIPDILIAEDVMEAALIRQELSNMPIWLAYLRAFAINCLFPISLLLAIVMKFWRMVVIIAFFGMLYAINMLQKSGPLLIVLPSILYLINRSKYLQAISWCFSVALVVVFMTFLSNPHLQPNFMRQALTEMPVIIQKDLGLDQTDLAEPDSDLPKTQHHQPSGTEESLTDSGSFGIVPLVGGLFDRVAYVPGRVVSQWTTLIPKEIPFGMGCGYRFLAPLLDCDFQNYALIIHDKLYPEYVARGLGGSVNAASMMVGYANFGTIGVLAYAFIQATLAWMIFVLFRNSRHLILPINIIYLFFLSSSDLLTMLLSGGWSLSILLFLMLARPKDEITDISATPDSDITHGHLPAAGLSGLRA